MLQRSFFTFQLLVVFGFKATLTSKVLSWWSVMHMFTGFLTTVLTQLFFPKLSTTFLMRKYARKKVCLNHRSNSQPPGHVSDHLPTRVKLHVSIQDLPLLKACVDNISYETQMTHYKEDKIVEKKEKMWYQNLLLFHQFFPKGLLFTRCFGVMLNCGKQNIFQMVENTENHTYFGKFHLSWIYRSIYIFQWCSRTHCVPSITAHTHLSSWARGTSSTWNILKKQLQ